MPTANRLHKVTSPELRVGLICADRDGNRIRIDQIDHQAGTLGYHYLNDELRVQEGTQQATIPSFLSEGWSVAASGKL